MMFLALRPMKIIFLNSSDLLEHLAMLLVSTIVIYCKLRNFLNKAISSKTFSKFYRKYYDLTLLKISCTRDFRNQSFYGDLLQKIKKIVDSNIFSAQFIKIISHYSGADM